MRPQRRVVARLLATATLLLYRAEAGVFNSPTVNTAVNTFCTTIDSEVDTTGDWVKVSYLGCLYHEHCRRVFGLYSPHHFGGYAFTDTDVHNLANTLQIPAWWGQRLLPLLANNLNTTHPTYTAIYQLVCSHRTLSTDSSDSLALVGWGFWLTSMLETHRYQSNGSLPLCNNGLPTCGPGQMLQPSSSTGFQCSCSQKHKGEFFVHSNSDTQCVTRGIDDTSNAMTTAVISVIVFQSLMLGLTLSQKQ
jgi:hypothetical protein